MSHLRPQVAIVGAGPAGLTAAYELTKHFVFPVVLEGSESVGGIARTEVYKGYRFDIGGHRFFTKVDEVLNLWKEVLGSDLIEVSRRSRIFYRGRFYDYPLSVPNVLMNLGAYESARTLLSYLKWKIRPSKEEESLEQWVINRFGGRLYWHFFRTYTEKVWGIPCTSIRADWAAQRIKDLSLVKAAVDALTGRSGVRSLTRTFLYPRLGPGMMWEAFRDRVVAAGGQVRLNATVERLQCDGSQVVGLTVRSGDATYTMNTDAVISSMPITSLVRRLQPRAPEAVLEAANRLKYRDFLIVVLILSRPDPFPDNWIYVHSADVKVARIQNFRSWSEEMVPDPDKSSIGMEYFCQHGDGLWNMDDENLKAMACDEIAQIGLVDPQDVIDATVIRQPKAYPVYDEEYLTHLRTIKQFLQGFDNLQTVGRNGMHRYNNQDHSMLTALLAARNVLGEHHDLWEVNLERSYNEEQVLNKTFEKAGAGS